MKKLYEGKLKLRKRTNQMLVYGDEILKAQYIPKELFPLNGKHPPDEIEVFIQFDSRTGKATKSSQ